MGSLIIILYIAEVIIALLLIGIVLIQQSKSQGGLGALSGGMTESIFGAATGNVITKATVVLATVFLVNTLLLAILTGRSGETATRAEELARGAQTREMQPRTASDIVDAIQDDIEQAAEQIRDGGDLEIERVTDPREIEGALEGSGLEPPPADGE